MTKYVLWMQPQTGDPEIDVPAATFRQLCAALVPGGGDGVLFAPGAGRLVSQRGAGANWTVDVAPFAAVVAGDDATDQGSYLIVSTATENVTICAGPPGSGTWTYRLVTRVRDKRMNGAWTTYDWDFYASGAASEPAEGASQMTLAHITVAAGQGSILNSHITNDTFWLRSLRKQGPWASTQNSTGSWNAGSAWTDYTGGQWPAVTFTVPPSGKVFITVGQFIQGPGGTEVAYNAYRLSGDYTAGAPADGAVGGRIYARLGRRKLWTGLPPGGSVTVTPQWYQSVNGGGDGNFGTLIVEAVD